MLKKCKLMLLAIVMFFYDALEMFHWGTAMPKMCLFDMTPEEQKQFDDLKVQNEKLLRDLDEATKPPKKDEKKDPPDDKTVLEAIRQKQREETEKAENEKRILDGAKFIATFDSLIKDGGEFFPKEVAAALDVISKKKYDNELQRADDLRASIAESVFSVQKNLDLLPGLGKTKVQNFLTLSQSAKEKQSAEIWEYVLAALDTHSRFEKQARTEAARRGFATPSGATADYENKIFGLRKKPSDKK